MKNKQTTTASKVGINYYACTFKTTSIFIISLFFCIPVGWGTDQLSGFGEERGTKHQVINLIHSIRTVMRSELKILVM